MDATTTPYDPRYLAGIVLFNRGDFFEAHEVWESIWLEEHGPDRQFYQGLIQAAVGLCHFCNGNVRGALKLYKSSRDYLARYGPKHHGLDLAALAAGMQECFAELLATPEPTPGTAIREETIPDIALDPPPDAWPDPAPFLEEEES